MAEKSKPSKPQRSELIPFSIRLQALINALGIEQQALAKTAEKNNSTITEYLRAKSQPSQDVVATWIKAYNVNANWLLTGEGPMFRGERGGKQEPTQGKAVAYQIRNLAPYGEQGLAFVARGDEVLPAEGLRVPVHAQTGAGAPVERFEFEPVFTVVIPTRFGRPGLQVIKVDGDSMEPEINNGAFVGVDTDDRTPRSGRVMAVAVPYEGLLIKRIFLDHEQGRLVLRSTNTSYPDVRLPLDDLDRLIVGRVAWVMQDL